jgi:hypothetical protein
VGSDGVGYGFDPVCGLSLQQVAGDLGTGLGVVSDQAVSVPTGDVVEQGSGAHDLKIGALFSGQAFGRGQHTQDVVKVVHSIGTFVVMASFFDGNQLGSSRSTRWSQCAMRHLDQGSSPVRDPAG